MKLKKGLKEGFREVKERLSPHHHHHQPDREQRRRKSGPNQSPRGPLAPVLDHLERDKLVPIHLHISHSGSVSITHKHSCSSISHSVSTLEEPPVAMPTPEPEPYVAPSPPEYGQEQDINPFLVEDPKEPLSDPEPTVEEPALPPLPPQVDTPPETVELSPAPALAPPVVNVPTPPPPVPEKPVPASSHGSDTASETDVPAVYLPQLVMPTMFLPIPNVRISSHLTWWLTRRTSVYY